MVCMVGLALVAVNCGGGGSTEVDGAWAQGLDGGQSGAGQGGSLPRDASTGSCSAITPAGAVLSWLDNGAPECAVELTAARTTSSVQDLLEVVSGTSTGLGLGFTVVSYDASPLGGTYQCKTDAGIGSQYVDFVYTSGTVVDCTITIDQAGSPGTANAVGTFSATVTTTSGGTTTVSQGVFNTPVTSAS